MWPKHTHSSIKLSHHFTKRTWIALVIQHSQYVLRQNCPGNSSFFLPAIHVKTTCPRTSTVKWEKWMHPFLIVPVYDKNMTYSSKFLHYLRSYINPKGFGGGGQEHRDEKFRHISTHILWNQEGKQGGAASATMTRWFLRKSELSTDHTSSYLSGADPGILESV